MDDNNTEAQVDTPRAAKGSHRKSSSSSLSISALFHGHLHRRPDLNEPPSSPLSPDRSPRVNPSKWIGSKHHNNNIQSPEIRGRCRNIATGIGRHRRRHTSDLTYDPLSYAHNFESDEDSPLKNSFTARLRAGEGAMRRPAAAETSAENSNRPPDNWDGKKARGKSFDLNDLMTAAKRIEELEEKQNAGDNNRIEMRSMATILEDASSQMARRR